MRLSKIIIFFISILSFSTISAKQLNRAYGAGEHLFYSVIYKIGFNVEVATVSMYVENDIYNSTLHNKITAIARVKPAFRWFYDLNHKYEIWVDSESHRPSYFQNDLTEENYKFKSTYNYNWDNMQVTTWSRNYNRDSSENHVMQLTENSFDAVSMFYKIRSLDIDSIKINTPYSLDIVFDDSIRRVYYKYMGKEVRNIKKIGKFSVLKFVCTLATSDGKPYEDGNEFTLYISDDENRIPVYIYTPIRVGSVTVLLSYYNNLLHPMRSLTK